MKLTSTNRPFGLSIEFILRSGFHPLSQKIFNTSLVVIPDVSSEHLPIYSVVKDRESDFLTHGAFASSP